MYIVRPEIVTLTLASGETLIVKKRLNAGERFDMYDAMKGADGQTNGYLYGMAKTLAFLLDWTVTDDATGAPLVIKDQPRESVKRTLRDLLDADDLKEIFAVIDAHDDKMQAERAAQKKTRGTKPASAPDSPSVPDSALVGTP